ncbi:dimethylaniline monooxygenase (n-oxide forming) [Phlyctema vagabunda]|uniref:Dimethylaniline monooxygenase (N-oxide forming) n=1 Tax=Phlyctema vagabunda TaxID=108571 RepID=A0ABR4P3H6_9HELO
MARPAVESVAIIGAGPAGAIAVDALAQEQAFNWIRVFERREKAGGCWIADPEDHVQQLPDLEKIAARVPDEPLAIPEKLPTRAPHNKQYRFAETSIYPHLETNIDADAMSFSQEPMPAVRSELTIQRHGEASPFRHWKIIEDYIQSLLNRNGYADLVSYNTTVELISKDAATQKWIVVLRRPVQGKEEEEDEWWTESFDAIVVAAGHYTVPYIPSTPGLAEFLKAYPGSVEHSKSWRSVSKYAGKKVVVVGASISGTDISFALAPVVQHPLHAVVRGKYHPYFFDWAFQHPNIERRPPISHISVENRTVTFEDGSSIQDVDHIIFGTGYTWTLPFLPPLAKTIRNNRLPNLWQHVFWNEDPSLTFVGAVAAGFTFKVFEWQAVLAARYLAGRIPVPDKEGMQEWEERRIAYKGDGVPFTALYPDFEEYFEEVRALAGEPTSNGKGRKLPAWEKHWREGFDAGHLLRIDMWKRGNEEARKALLSEQQRSGEKDGQQQVFVQAVDDGNDIRV